MSVATRSWWHNCGVEEDAEIREIDRMEDMLAQIPDDVYTIRRLISSLEMCHHKGERWVENIIHAVGSGQTSKGIGTRSAGGSHPVERVWQSTCASLSAWIAGSPADSVGISVGSIPASHLLARLGPRTPLKEWQVQRVAERIRSFIDWPRSPEDPSSQYVGLLECGSEYESSLRSECPEFYMEHRDFWLATAGAILHDTENGEDAELPLAIAIDMLMPCHWDFVENLGIVLGAIGGELRPDRPFSACARNIHLAPVALG